MLFIFIGLEGLMVLVGRSSFIACAILFGLLLGS